MNHKIVGTGVISLDQNIELKILNDWKMMISVKSKRTSKLKEEQWRQKLDRAFNILICHCPFKVCPEYGCSGCSNSIHLACVCPLEAKIPLMEVPFFHSQLTKVGTKGGIMIGSVDKVEPSRQTKALVRAEKKEAAAAEKEAKKKVAKELEAKKQSDFENDFKEENNNTSVDDDEEFNLLLLIDWLKAPSRIALS